MSAESERGARRALFIGIDAYQRIRPLDGCVNDVRLMRSVLEEVFAFPSENITMLTDAEATRANILAALDMLVASTDRDDIVVIHYAGHGSQMTDLEGDEPSGLDSTIMPVDSEGWQGDNRDITDDEIHLRLLALGKKTDFTTLIFDCCHSGTITRDAFGGKARSAPADRRPPEELREVRRKLGIELARLEEQESGPSGVLPLSGKYVLIAGCRDEELSYEHRPEELGGEVAHGALTYYLTRELRAATPGTTYRDVYERASVKVTAANGRQHPQMEGNADREIFGVRDFEPMRFLRVSERDGTGVTLAAGAPFGVTVGSTYTVYPQATKHPDRAESLGEVRVDAVRATTSHARITSETVAGAIVANARAFESEHAYGDMRMPVQLVLPAVDEALVPGPGLDLRHRLERARSVKLVDAGEVAALRVYLIAPRTSVRDSDPVPQLGNLAEVTWAAIKEDGELAMPPKPIAQQGDIVTNLEAIARYRYALALENPDPRSKLRERFEIVLLRKRAGEWLRAEPDPDTNQTVFEEGDDFGLRVISRHDQPAFVSILDFGLAGAISLLHPVPGAKEILRPGGSFDVTDLLPIEFPDVFPFADDPVRGPATRGVETIKLIATTKESDFSFLEQAGVRSTRSSSPLMLLWESATLGSSTRDTKRLPVDSQDGDGEDWTTVVKPFVLRRRGT